jgi:hypothetical protein
MLSLVSGAVGASAYEQLARERDKQMKNLDVLRQINRELEGDTEALLYDSDTIAAYARELGYGTVKERFVRIVGLSGAQKQHRDPGQIVSALRPEFMPEADIRFISLAIGMGVFGCILVVELMRTRRPEL